MTKRKRKKTRRTSRGAVTERDLSGAAKERRRRFIALYTHPDYGMNGARAAEDAGFSPVRARQAAHELLQDPDVVAEINRELERRIERTRVSGDKVIMDVARVARVNLRDLLELRTVKRGRAIRQELFLKADSLDQLHPDDVFAIRELETTKEGVRVKLHEKTPLFGLLLKYSAGQFRDPMSIPPRPAYTPDQHIALMVGLLQVLAKRREQGVLPALSEVATA